MSLQPQKRRMRGFEPAAGLVREPVRKAGESRGFTVARLLTHWPEVVGDEIAGQTLPVKVSYGKGGFGATLTLLTTGPSAPLVQMQLEQIRARVNACYGYNAPDPVAVRRAADAVSAVLDPDLRAALAMLGQNVLSRCKHEPRSGPTLPDLQKG